jgi:hypothetical protein
MSQESLPQPQRFVSPEGGRRIDLDWVRVAAFGLLIFYHVGMLYVSWGFHIKSEHRITELEPLMLLLNPWRLALLFLVSGVATQFMLAKSAPGRLWRSRTVRLLPPLLFGMLVIVPPQAYLQVLESVGYDGGFFDFYLTHYFAFGPQFCHPGPCLLLPTWNHLWFVAYSLDLHDGAWRRSRGHAGSRAACRASGDAGILRRLAARSAGGPVRSLSAVAAAVLSVDPCLVR